MNVDSIWDLLNGETVVLKGVGDYDGKYIVKSDGGTDERCQLIRVKETEGQK